METPIEATISVAVEEMCPGTANTLIFSFSENVLVDVEIAEGNNPPLIISNVSNGQIIPIFPTTTTTYTLVNIFPQGSICPGTIALNQVTVMINEISVEANATSDFNGFGVSCPNSNDGSATATPVTGVSPCLLYTSPSPRDATLSRMPSSA